ncbi:MAG: Na+ dependent nucleoside transporter N-terminal domain-containing protein, partial [Pseudomonadota bacterium]
MAFQGLIGLVIIPLVAWAISENRRALKPRDLAVLVGGAIAVQFALVIVLLTMPWTRVVFDGLGQAVLALQNATDAGAQLVFGYLAGGSAPFET